MFNVVGLNPSKFAQAEVAVVQRLCTRDNLNALTLFKKMGLKVVYDLDDDLWSVPPYNPSYHLLRGFLKGFDACGRMADVITVSTAHLKLEVQKAFGRTCPRVEVIENSMDFNYFRPIKDEYRRTKNDQVILGWAGSDTHAGDVNRVFSLLPELMREFPELRIEIAGMKVPPTWSDFADRVKQRYFIPVAEYASSWPSWQWDIALAPLEDNRFNRSKSSIKLLEAAAIGIPCVASDFGEYAKFCSSSKLLKTTVLASTATEWKEKLRALIRDAALRKQIGDEMLYVAKERFHIANALKRWNGLFNELTGS